MYRQYRRKISRQIQKLFGTKNRKRQRPTYDLLGFNQLESRQLLAIIATPVPDGTNLVVNGDFEQTQNSGPQFAADDVVGWNVDVNVLEEEIINIFNTTRAGNLLELDSKSNVEDRIFQDVVTESGDQYVLAFDLRERFAGAGADAASNFVDVFWDGQAVGTFAADTMWQTIVINVTGGAGESSRLEFREVASGNDGIGALIDNVRVMAVSDVSIGNGSFETGSATGLVAADEIAGWESVGSVVADRQLNIVNDGNAADGDRYVNVETTDSHVDRIYQDVSTEAGGTYYVMFDLRGDGDTSETANELRIRWNDRWAGTFEGGIEWQSYGVLVNATSDVSRLVFREAGSGSGPFIDNVRVVQVDQGTEAVNDFVIDLTSANATFTEGGEAVSVLSDVSLEHASNRSLTEARFKLDSVPDGSDEVLSVDVGSSGLNSFYDSAEGRLVINGTASLEVYSDVMRTLTYENTSDDPTIADRSISGQIIDSTIGSGNQFSQRQFVTVQLVSVNDAPTIEDIGPQEVAFGATLRLQTVASDADGGDVEYSVSTTGNVGSEQVAINDQGVITWTNFAQEGNVDVTVVVTDSNGLTASTDFRIFAGGFDPFSGNRDLSAIEPAARNGIYSAAPEMTIDTSLDYQAILKTDVGDITLDLFDDLAPITVNNFVNLAEDGFYDGVTFHRVITNFVAQGGDPLGTGTGGPGYQFEDEFDDSLRFTGSGQLAMANSGPATNGSQFFITYAAQPHLNDAHTIFGQLTDGNAALNAIAVTSPGVDATVINSVEIVVS